MVTVTGISGYVGSRVGLAFLNDGEYRVRGTVRDLNNASKLDPLRDAYDDQVEFVQADLLDSISIMKAIEGSDYVIHTASPFVIEEPKDEDELIRPAVEGTKAVM